MSALSDALRAAAQAGRAAAASAAQRDTVVTVEVTTYAQAVGMSGAGAGTTTTTTITPPPKVTRVGPGDPSWFGGGVEAGAGGALAAPLWRVGPITKRHPGGGYDADELAPEGGATKRVLYRLAGDDFEAGGELHRIVGRERETPQSVVLLVQRTRQ